MSSDWIFAACAVPDARVRAAALARQGVDMLDAPVSGGEAAAQAGTLAIMAGGNEETFTRMKPLLELLGRTLVHVGD